jgi:hypothetical protein
VSSYSGALLSWNSGLCECGGVADVAQFPPRLTITQIPEPATMLLVLPTLAAARLTRRRLRA